MKPQWKSEIRARLAGLHLAPTREAAIVEELAQYLDDYYAELLASGATEAEAYRQALTELSGSELLAHELRRAERHVAPEHIVLGTNRRRNMIADLWQDLRYGARTLLKQPSFTLIAVLTLALGIGANTAISSVTQAVLRHPLPYPEPERLVLLYDVPLFLQSGAEHKPPSEWFDWRPRTQSFESLSAYGGFSSGVNLMVDGEPAHGQVRIEAAEVMANFFDTMGVTLLRGRSFLPVEEEPGQPKVAVISHDLWQRRFGGQDQIIGQTVRLNDRACTIVGVTPPGFQYPGKVELWLPIARHKDRLLDVAVMYYQALGRLKRGVMPDQMQSELAALSAWLREQTSYKGSAQIVPLAQQLRFVSGIQGVLRILNGAAICLLLIACVSVANMLLARGVARERELAIRVALGAGRWRVLRQLLLESLLLTLAGGVGGALFVALGLNQLRAIGPPVLSPVFQQIQLNVNLLGSTLLVALVIGLLFALLLAWQAAQLKLPQALNEGGVRTGVSRRVNRARGLLVMLETALALVVAVCGSLMMKSFAHLRTADPGLNIDDTVMIATALRTDKYGSPAQREPFFAQLRERLRHLPGLQIEDFTNSFPLSDNQYFAVLFSIEGHSPAAQSTGRSFDYQTVSPEGLKSLGLRLTQGRMFTGRDTHTSTPVVILNQALARRYWPAENPIGERLIAPGDKFSREVVGIVSNGGAAEPNQPQMFVPAAQAHLPSRFVTVRAQVPLLGLTAEVHKAVKAIDRGIHISDLLKRQTDVTTDDRFLRAMLVMFAALGLLLAPLGLYGVLSFSVAQRTPEFGIRLALGAQARDVLKLVLRQGLKLALAGIMFGLGMAFMVSRVMSGMLFGVGNVDPLTLVVNAVLLTAVALLACWIPARRATKVDPMIALRTE